MELRVLTPDFIALGILERVDSVIWTERYNEVGDFELYLPFSEEALDLLQPDNVLTQRNSDRRMIIDSINILTDMETGDKLVVKGQSLESILDRRIILRQIQIDDTLQNGIEAILNADVISGIYPERNFPNFIFQASTDPVVTGFTIQAQYYSQNLLDVIRTLCQQANLGFKIIINSSNQYVFSLFAGKDRSYTQTENIPYVVFSPKFDNLIKSDYYYTKKFKKNYILVSGDPTGMTSLPLRAQYFGPELTGDPATQGLHRREMFFDASDMSRYEGDTTTPIADATYLSQLYQRGVEESTKHQELEVFDGQADLSRTYTYGVDFFLGDIIQMADAYGHINSAQITEMTFSESLSGSSIYPTLKTL